MCLLRSTIKLLSSSSFQRFHTNPLEKSVLLSLGNWESGFLGAPRHSVALSTVDKLFWWLVLIRFRQKVPYHNPQSHDIQTREILGDRSDSHLQPGTWNRFLQPRTQFANVSNLRISQLPSESGVAET